jgi:hypothetical protein
MARKRFNAAEKQLIAQGGDIEWQNVTQWHPARIVDGCGIETDDGWQYVLAYNHATTRTVHRGDVIRVSPGHIRETCRGNPDAHRG